MATPLRSVAVIATVGRLVYQLEAFLVPVTLATTVGVSVSTYVLPTTVMTIGRIMSLSSWPRMWQCQTYSQPKDSLMLSMVAGTPELGSTWVNPRLVPRSERTLRGRMLSPSENGRT